MTFYVEPNNWTKNIPKSLNSDNKMSVNSHNGLFSYEINVDNAYDPAFGCDKEFNASYKCGQTSNNFKHINIDKEARGKIAEFDCTAEYNLCNTLQLRLDDNGHLTLIKKDNNDNDEVLWTNATSKINKSHPSYSNAEYKAEKGTNGKNYLTSGEFLSEGQWIGSPSGKYRLIMENGKLQVLYNRLACSTEEGPDNDASNLYQIPTSYPENLGKMGYINREGQLQVYPNKMTSDYTNRYSEVEYEGNGGFNVIGADISTIDEVPTAKECQDKCSEYNNMDSDSNSSSNLCAGIVFNETDKKCNLKSNEVYTKQRIISENHKYYLRTKNVNNNISCPSDPADYVYGSTSDWQGYTLNNTEMDFTTKCGLAHFTESVRNDMDASYNLLRETINDGAERIQLLDNKNNIMKQDLIDTKIALDSALTNTEQTRDQLENMTTMGASGSDIPSSNGGITAKKLGKQLEQLVAMNEDRSTNMISQNYKHILWSILAILIIIGTIKLTKQRSSSTI